MDETFGMEARVDKGTCSQTYFPLDLNDYRNVAKSEMKTKRKNICQLYLVHFISQLIVLLRSSTKDFEFSSFLYIETQLHMLFIQNLKKRKLLLFFLKFFRVNPCYVWKFVSD